MRGTGTTTAHPRTARPWLPRSTPWPLHHATSLGDAPHSRATARVAPSLPLWHTPYGDARGAQTMPGTYHAALAPCRGGRAFRHRVQRSTTVPHSGI
jgi:hypothetical protein